jgi:hypothetical protein
VVLQRHAERLVERDDLRLGHGGDSSGVLRATISKRYRADQHAASAPRLAPDRGVNEFSLT